LVAGRERGRKSLARLAALVGFANGGLVAVMFVFALALLMASLVDLAREIRVHIATMGLD